MLGGPPDPCLFLSETQAERNGKTVLNSNSVIFRMGGIRQNSYLLPPNLLSIKWGQYYSFTRLVSALDIKLSVCHTTAV